MLVPISPQEIMALPLGEPLPYSIFDANGRLLMRKGLVISMPSQREKMADSELFRNPREDAAGAEAKERIKGEEQTPFDTVDGIATVLRTLLNVVREGGPERMKIINFPMRIQRLAGQLSAACEKSPETAIAAAHLDYSNPYSVTHHITVAVICDLLGRAEKLPDEKRLSLVCAALTHDLSILELADGNAPAEGVKEMVNNHPEATVKLLQAVETKDVLWLNAVWRHHERLDGSGYPRGVTGENLNPVARILAIADVYSAMTRPRPYRDKAFLPQNAMREIFLGKEQLYDDRMVQVLIKTLGLVPPGMLVKLKNGEIGMVIKRTMLPTPPVLSLLDVNGFPIIEGIRRDTAIPEYQIVGRAEHADCQNVSFLIRKYWHDADKPQNK